ncbi:MAG: holo-ACP synthase [Epsilonproteobacteria bacterium]|nr:holo-ACP synthase [Campylobacterota bacterium]
MQIGTDIVSIDRIKESLERFGDRFLDRVFNQEERDTLNLNRVQSVAGYWASKEAISKALGCGIGRDLSFLDITISKDRRGKPHFKLSVEAGERFNIRASSLSIAHDGGFAVAVVAIEF